ncbi:MAG: amino acid permease [Cyclobacteriaceae bacterium]|nr:amino acid permease [Cyclobacteriaceae bacterium]
MKEKKLGLWSSTSLVTGNMIGSGIFLLPATLATIGSISLLGWLISGAGAWALARVFVKFSVMVPATSGGPYVFTRRGLGDFAGFLVAWGYWISIWCSNAAIAIAFVGYLSVFVPPLSEHPFWALLTGLGVVWLLVWINTRGIKNAGIFQVVTTLLKIAPLLAIGLMGLFFIRPENFIPFNLSGMSDFRAITMAATLTFYAYMGLECATIPAADVKNPEKTIPKATFLGLILTLLVYVLCSVAVMGVVPAMTLQHSNAPLADAAQLMWGEKARYLVAFGAMVSTLGALNGWILVQGQIPAAIARDRLFPAIFSKLNQRGVPTFSIILSCILLSLLMSMNYANGLVKAYEFALLLASMTALIAYLFTSVAYSIVHIETSGWTSTSWKTLVLAFIAFFFSVWAIAGSGKDIVYWGFILLMAGLPFYAWRKINNLK